MAKCNKTAILNVNCGVAKCNLPEGHEGQCEPHPDFWKHV